MSKPRKAISAIPTERIEKSILLIRGQKVILDRDLAELYAVETFNLNKAVKRNSKRFPTDFMFQLTKKEFDLLRCQCGTSNHENSFLRFHLGISKPEKKVLESQSVIPKEKRGGRRYRPYAFTEHGVAMLSSVLHSQRAIDVNIAIMRAFVRLREILASHKDLARKLDELERKYDEQFRVVFDAIRQLMTPPAPESNRRIGFRLQK